MDKGEIAMADINGTPNNDTLLGTAEADRIFGGDGQDIVSGEGASDLIDGGAGDDVLYGDAGVGTAQGRDATPITLDFANRVADTGNNASVGDSVVYRDVAQLADGTAIWGRLILVATSDSRMPIDLTGGRGFEILLNSASRSRYVGETATFRLEFFDPETGEAVALNSTATFNDLDQNSPGDHEAVTVDADSFTAFSTADVTSLAVTQSGGAIRAQGTQANSPEDQDAWFSAQFENREFIEFELEARSSQSGFTLSGDLITDVVETPIKAGNDTLLGGEGADTLFGQGGNDFISGGDGNDQIFAGAGEDTILSGLGADRVEGGADSDLFVFDGAGDHTLLGGEDADGLDVDRIDLTGIDRGTYRLIREAPEAGRIEFLNDAGHITGRTNYSQIEEVIICFTPGTMIATKRGEKPIQQLKVGDMVITRDNGLRPVRWIGRRNLNRTDLHRMQHYYPIMIRKGALGPGVPDRDMMVSPNHRMLIASELAEMMFAENEVLVAAKHLVRLDGVEEMPVQKVSYIHVLFDQHEVILANGAWAESFQPGEQSMDGIKSSQREEILELFPDLIDVRGLRNFSAARRLLKAHEAHLMTLEEIR